MKIKELDRCLRGKLRMEDGASARHTDYRLRCSGRIIGLPTLIRISHGSGELANNNIGGVAKALGLSEHALHEMVGCRVGRACVLLCLSSKLLEFVRRQREEQGEVFRPGVLAMLESVNLLLSEPELVGVLAWNSAEMKALERTRSMIGILSADKDFGSIARKLIDRIAAA
jgi:hypothetical protein